MFPLKFYLEIRSFRPILPLSHQKRNMNPSVYPGSLSIILSDFFNGTCLMTGTPLVRFTFYNDFLLTQINDPPCFLNPQS